MLSDLNICVSIRAEAMASTSLATRIITLQALRPQAFFFTSS
jgi:hypothetical protein